MEKIKKNVLLKYVLSFLIILITVSVESQTSFAAESTINLSAAANPSGNSIQLNWENNDTSQLYSYMLYSKSNNDSEFQSIPSKDTVKVLNVYPNSITSKIPVTGSVSFTSALDKKVYTLPNSALLKMWMERANAENPKGYGKGYISVDAVPITDFNNDSESYLKNAEGNYKYDVVFFGSWDGNSGQTISESAEAATEHFVDSGRGLLFGHDTALCSEKFGTLAKKYGNMFTITNMGPGYMYGCNQIMIRKKGLLTGYPWNIGNIGDILNVPMSHTSWQFAMGDIWMSYPQNILNSGKEITSCNGKSGTNNFYLTTWNNVAMIQTGHSCGAATTSEQKIIANTLFYLAQITDETSWDDHKGQDLSAPTKPDITGVIHNSDRSTYTVQFNSSTDNATSYQYYVEATRKSDGQKYTSPKTSASIMTDMKGYNIVADNNPDTELDGTVRTNSTSYTFNRPSGSSFYVHVAAVDNVGNVSATSTYHVDELISVTHPISISYSIDPNSSTPFSAADIPIVNNSSIPINIYASSLDAITGGSINLNDVKSITYTDWSKLTLAQTKSDIALGIYIKNPSTGSSTWSTINRSDTLYSAGMTGKNILGTLNPNGARGILGLNAKFGLAWDESYTSAHRLHLVFQVN